MELEREKEQLEDDLLACLGKIDRMQKKIDEMTLNENHDAEFIAKVMKERDRVLAEKKATLGGSEKSFRTRERREQRGHATQECRAGGRAPTDEAGASGEQESGRGPRCSTEGASASGAGVPGAGVPDEVHSSNS